MAESVPNQPTDAEGNATRRIHPIIMYPFSHPSDVKDLHALYTGLIKRLSEKPDRYSRPITVLNRQTHYNNALWKHDPTWNKSFKDFLNDPVKTYSTMIDAWCVDSCQMWLAGFGHAFDKRATAEDVYWLIPGDFNYASDEGQRVLETIENIPEAVFSHEQELCLGEIEVPVNSAKQLIDTYGTYGLLYNWFPSEAQEIRKKTDKPRTEFFAISHSFLKDVLGRRWYGYEQTIVILLHATIGGKRIHKCPLGKITDMPQGRESLASAMQQVERTERVLKLFWRETNEKRDVLWPDTFRKLDAQSEQIRGAALVILEQILR